LQFYIEPVTQQLTQLWHHK